MATLIKFLRIFVALVMVQGCTTNIEPDIHAVPVEDNIVIKEGAGQETSQQPSPEQGAAGESATQPAVIALLDLSKQEQQSGRVEIAIAAIERALRLDSKNPVLWTQLANLRLAQGNWQQAYVLANKSNSLSRDNVSLQLENWRIIEMAKARQGDSVAVEEARAQIRALSDQP